MMTSVLLSAFAGLSLISISEPAFSRPQVENQASTLNLAPNDIRLGKARSKFFERILRDNKFDERKQIPSNGYWAMTMDNHTAQLWPAGRADTVIFYMHSSGVNYLTAWGTVKGRPHRLWQHKLVPSKKHSEPSGTLAKWLASHHQALLGQPGAAERRFMDASQAYAAYEDEGGPTDIYLCYFVRPDGSETPHEYGIPHRWVGQDMTQASKSGFYITPEESKPRH